MKTAWVVLFLIPLVFGAGADARAAESYVTDSFEITLRTGPSTGNKIVAMLSSGQPVEVLGTEGEWSHVRVIDDEKEGWVVSRYLINRMPWEIQAKALEEKAAGLRAKLGQTDKDLGAMTQQSQELAAQLKRKTQELEKLQKEHSDLQRGAQEYLKLKALYEESERNLAEARSELLDVTNENEMMRSSELHTWFLKGALVILSGLLIGTMIGRQQKRRRSSYA